MPIRVNSPVARLLPIATIAVIAVVVLIPGFLEIIGNGDSARRLGGDFPSFYAAGSIVAEGQSSHLYDAGLQLEYQKGFHGESEYLYFAYPPFVALGYSILAGLPYGIAFSIHALISLGALIAASWYAIPRVAPNLSRGRHVTYATALALVAYPILRSMLGGQNTAFSLLAIVGVWWGIDVDKPWVAGLALAALAFKPQFALVLVILLVAARMWRVLALGAIGGFAVFVATSLVFGWAWPIDWLDQVRIFGGTNDVVNGPLMVNITGWVGTVIGKGAASSTVSLALVAVVGVASVAVAWKVGLRWGVVGSMSASIVLLSPSTLYYDAGIALFAFGVFSCVVWQTPRPAAFVAVLSWVQIAEESLAWSPLFLVVLALFVSSLGFGWRPTNVSHPLDRLAALAEPDGGETTWRVTG